MNQQDQNQAGQHQDQDQTGQDQVDVTEQEPQIIRAEGQFAPGPPHPRDGHPMVPVDQLMELPEDESTTDTESDDSSEDVDTDELCMASDEEPVPRFEPGRYVVDGVYGIRLVNGRIECLTKWEGYEEMTWEWTVRYDAPLEVARFIRSLRDIL